MPTPPISVKVDYSSPFLCRLDLSILRGARTSTIDTGMGGGALLHVGEQPDHVSVDVGGVSDVPNQSHLTKVVIGCEEEERETAAKAEEEDVLSSIVRPESPEEIIMQVCGWSGTLCLKVIIIYTFSHDFGVHVQHVLICNLFMEMRSTSSYYW